MLLGVVLAAGVPAGAAGAEASGGSPAAVTLAAPVAVIPGLRRHGWTTDPLATFRLYAIHGLLDPRLLAEPVSDGAWRVLRPIVAAGIDPVSRSVLDGAFPEAVRRIETASTCRALYEQLGTEGLFVLATTVYVRPTSAENAALCDRLSAIAYTRVGQQTTVICPAFGKLGRQRAAVTLLHEALHYAGMPERPGDPSALSSSEITVLVKERCDL